MIRPLRIQHRRVFAVLGLVLPVTFALGIAARKPVPQMDGLSVELRPAGVIFRTPLWERDGLFTNAPVRVRLLSAGNRFAVALSAPADFVKPDLLVYWTANTTARPDHLPGDAALLGAFAAPVLPLPAAAAGSTGAILLFSLADQEVVAVSRPVSVGDSTR